jgi:hypothetical protein
MLIRSIFGGEALGFARFSFSTLNGLIVAPLFGVFELLKKRVVCITKLPQAVICRVEIIPQRCAPLLTSNRPLEFEWDPALIEVSAVLNQHEFGFALCHVGTENSRLGTENRHQMCLFYGKKS